MSLSSSTIPHPGSARLPVVVVCAIASFLMFATLEYSLPLYFNAVDGFPRNVWSQLVLWQVIPWIVSPALAGMLSRRFGERRVWGAALAGQAAVPLVLWAFPEPWVVRPVALWYGLTNSLMWVGGISLAQIVPPEKKGLANGLMMMALGVGSVFGPLVGRTLVWRHYARELWDAGDWTMFGRFLINLSPPPGGAPLANFRAMLLGLSVAALATALLVYFGGQYRGESTDVRRALSARQVLGELRCLVTIPKFWALTICLCLLGGPVFQATNQFLKYRAEDLRLLVGAEDHGWVLLELLRKGMWIPGGLAVGLLAGRQVSGMVAVVILALFSLAGLGIGLADRAGGLFVVVALFEITRQFMRWLHSGYLSEHMPAELRATAIGCSVSMAGLGASLFGALPLASMDAGSAEFRSSQPYFIAATIGLAGALCLAIFDRLRPIRQPLASAASITISSSVPETSAV